MKIKIILLLILNFVVFNQSFSDDMFNHGKEIFLKRLTDIKESGEM